MLVDLEARAMSTLSKAGCPQVTETSQHHSRDRKPLVSVIIPTYNRWPLVTETIDSALGQDYPNVEVIVVDDGSTDETETELTKRYGSRVRYLKQENQGPGAARNTGIEIAAGEYIAFLDSDDLWLPNKLSVQVAAMADNEEWALAYNPCLIVAADGRNTGQLYMHTGRGRTGDNFELMLNLQPIMTSAVIMRRAVFDKVSAFDEEMLSAQDVDLWLRVTMHYPAGYIRAPLTLTREHPGRWSHYVTPTGIRMRAGVYMFRKLLTSLPPERESSRPRIQRSLLWSEFHLLCLEAEGLTWAEFADEVAKACRAAEDLRATHHLSAWTVEAIGEWERTHRSSGTVTSGDCPPSPEQLGSLVEVIASEAQRRGSSKNAWKACLLSELGLHRLAQRRVGGALGYLARGAGRHLPAAVAHCVWQFARAVRNALRPSSGG